ncbi:MFS transporter [Streptomyces avicenniae]|uniref:MFS transporter n=1 Tax=Streptomyces avicenniae TaxID=500153 RepID=UPI000AED593B|nr:MFS transporter [Streptomyces avicenniae]
MIETDDATTARPVERLPRTYLLWLTGLLASVLGDTVLYFGLGWAASAHGGGAAGLLLTAISLPRTALLLVGGAVADRWGARRVLIAGDATMLVVAVAACVAVWWRGSPLWLLITIGLAVGTVDAFYLPASGSMPRRLVPPAVLGRALALRQTGAQLIALAGGSLGGFLVGAAGLGGVALFDALTFALMLAVLLTIRPPATTRESAPASTGVRRDLTEGLRLVRRDRTLRTALLMTSCAAGCLIPVPSLLLPLLGRQQGWSAGTTGLLVAAQTLGVVAVAGWVTWRGGLPRPMAASAGGLLVAGAGAALLAGASSPVAAGAAAALSGLGTGLFATHVAPLLLGGTPESHLARVQAVVGLAQSCPLLVMNVVLGNLAAGAGVTAAFLCCATMATVTGLTVLRLHRPDGR